ncbi:hypothetical protein Ple7327_3616 [Pleurocapsa sp. PCC 7327]|nr:hypothetical protein Ple7327_3616 [Pleurocapsa sp. PCC 7327]
MMLLENKAPKYTVYSEKVEREKRLGEQIGGIPLGYKLERIKQYSISRSGEVQCRERAHDSKSTKNESLFS